MKVVDLFCGVGGLSLGFQKAGLPTVAAYDNWLPAVETYSWNMKHSAECLDLLDVNAAVGKIKPLHPDMIIGGPPCQDFSSAGKRSEGENASLTIAFARIVATCHPRVVVMENVPRARSSVTYQEAKKLLLNAGYELLERVLDSSFCGVPQIRKRFFVIGWRKVRPNAASRLEAYFEDAATTERLTISRFMGDELSIANYYRHPRNYSRRAVFSVEEPSPTVRGVNRPVPPSYKGHPLDSAPAHTVRPLTAYERSRVQTFPKNWIWESENTQRSKTDIELLIGNAVPVNLARFVGQGVKEGVCCE